jgi:hypothetical protein
MDMFWPYLKGPELTDTVLDMDIPLDSGPQTLTIIATNRLTAEKGSAASSVLGPLVSREDRLSLLVERANPLAVILAPVV